MDYSKTLHLPKTDFPMRGNLPQKEPEFLKMWTEMDLYHKRLQKRNGAPKFVLHDGPPYANGTIHIGHALNKTIKDIIVKYHAMRGKYANYVPGWDTHGLPIEYAVLKSSGEDRANMTPLELRQKCLAYAKKWIEIQKADFIRLGVIGDWDKPYVTFDPNVEAHELEVFGKMAAKGYIYKGKKAVYWCPHCETALAEAEIEYKDRKSPSIYVKFPADDIKNLGPEGVPKEKLFAVIWTTTPWTIPANLAICVNPKLDYVWVHDKEADAYYLMCKDLAPSSLSDCGITEYEFVGREMKGEEWELATFRHPLIDRPSYVLLGNHVTTDAGTGCVHTAPGHGVDDFEVVQTYNNKGLTHLDPLCPVDGKGNMTEECEDAELVGLSTWDAEGKEISRLAHAGMLLGKKSIHHQYAHCWRCKEPIIYRATDQWFASINDFRDQALKAVDDTKFYPAWGHDRLYNMIRDRQDWCISRQRSWGVPIPAFYCEDCGKYIITEETVQSVMKIVAKESTDAWWAHSAEELLPEGFHCPHCGGTHFRKETDIMDVWFDSGSSWNGVMKAREGLGYPADLYLEGSDQYRGWFNSSLITSVAVNGHAPYRAILSQGFVLDGKGEKMSKSLGNTILPSDVEKQLGAEILRLWVTSVDTSNDVRISMDILKQTSETYRKIRNTLRFLIANTSDFDPQTDAVAYEDLRSVDKYLTIAFNRLVAKIRQGYQAYDFMGIYKAVVNFLTIELSAFYLDFAKDVVYIEAEKSLARRQMQTVFYDILVKLTKLLTPILPHTAEEIWSYLEHESEDFVQLAEMPEAHSFPGEEAIVEEWEAFMDFRDKAQKALEEARNAKLIGKSLEAHLLVYPSEEVKVLLASLDSDLAQLLIVSQLTITDQAAPADAMAFDNVAFQVQAATGEVCDRCRRTDVSTAERYGVKLCDHCAAIVEAEFPEAVAQGFEVKTKK